MEYKLKLENGRSCEIYCESDGKPLQDKINAAEERFGSKVKTINGKEVAEHGLGGFLVGAIIGGLAGNAVAKQGVKKTIKSVARKTTSTVKKAVDSVKKKEAPKSKRANYIPNRLIDSIETKSGKTIENKDIIDGAHTKSNVLVSKKRVDSHPKDLDKSKKLSLQSDYLSARNIKVINTTYGRKLKGSELLDGTYVKKGVFGEGGSIDSFNFKKFKLDELIHILPEDVRFMWMHIQGDENYENYIRSYGPKYKSVKDIYWTITDYSKFELSKGEENIYLDMMVYKEDIKAPEVPYTISLYTKDNHIGLKNFASMLIQKFKNGGSVSDKVYYETPNVGSSKYTVSYYDGKKTNSDGSAFYDIAIFKNKLELKKFLDKLKSEGYRKRFKDGGKVSIEKGYKVGDILDHETFTGEFPAPSYEVIEILGISDGGSFSSRPRSILRVKNLITGKVSEINEGRFNKMQKMSDGGKLKWADARKGDSARVVSENKMGMIVKDYGRKFHLKFPDGTEKTYDASDLEFYKLGDDEYGKGGSTMSKYAKGGKTKYYLNGFEESLNYILDRTNGKEVRREGSKEDGDLIIYFETTDEKNEYANGGGVGSKSSKIYKLRAEGLNDFLAFLQKGMYFRVKSFTVQPMGVPDVVVTFETDASLSEIKSKLREVPDSHVMLQTIKPINQYTGERNEEYAKGGMTEHGLRLGDEIVKASPYSQPEYITVNDKMNQKHFVNLNEGERSKPFAKGGVIGQEITFNHWSGDVKKGTIDEVHSNGDYVVQSGYGSMLVNPDDVISMNAPAPAQKKFLGIFEDGGFVPNGYVVIIANNQSLHFPAKYAFDESTNKELLEDIDFEGSEDYKTLYNFISKEFNEWLENSNPGSDYEEMYYGDGDQPAIFDKSGAIWGAIHDVIFEDLVQLKKEGKKTVINLDKYESDFISAFEYKKGGKLKYADGGGVGKKGDYMLLGRLQADCDFYLGFGNRNERRLWAGNVKDQIAEMKSIYNRLSVKPEWITMKDINRYEKEMTSKMSKGGGVGKSGLIKIALSDMEDSDFQTLQQICESNDIAFYIDESEMYVLTDLDQIKLPFINDRDTALDIIGKYDVEKMSKGGGVGKKYDGGGRVESNLLTDQENATLKQYLKHPIFKEYKEIETFSSGGNNYHTMILLSNDHIVTINWEFGDVQYSYFTYNSTDEYARDPEDDERGWDNEFYRPEIIDGFPNYSDINDKGFLDKYQKKYSDGGKVDTQLLEEIDSEWVDLLHKVLESPICENYQAISTFYDDYDALFTAILLKDNHVLYISWDGMSMTHSYKEFKSLNEFKKGEYDEEEEENIEFNDLDQSKPNYKERTFSFYTSKSSTDINNFLKRFEK